MKIRNGFVSNSSSSSFVIARQFVSDEKVQEMKELYERLVEESEIYDDNGTHFQTNKYFITYSAYNAPEEWRNFIKSLKLPEDARMCVHEG